MDLADNSQKHSLWGICIFKCKPFSLSLLPGHFFVCLFSNVTLKIFCLCSPSLSLRCVLFSTPAGRRKTRDHDSAVLCGSVIRLHKVQQNSHAIIFTLETRDQVSLIATFRNVRVSYGLPYYSVRQPIVTS